MSTATPPCGREKRNVPGSPLRGEDLSGKGRNSAVRPTDDALGRQTPTERQIGILLFVASLILYLASMCWPPFPGLPALSLMTHLKLESSPAVLDSLWGWGVRVFAHLPWLPVSAWTGLFSACCGALCVSLLGRLMTRVSYLIRNEPGPDSFIREAQARRLSGVVAGLFLACSIPFWWISTRSLPGSFHLLLLLSAAWFFSQYQHSGKRRYLGLLGLFCGVGVTEFATFWIYIPLAVFLVTREMVRWRALKTWRAHLILWAGVLIGLSLYPFNALMLYRQGAYLAVYASPWQALLDIFRSQASLIVQVRYSAGFPVIMFFTLVPWLTLFAMSRRSPWFYEGGQVVVRLIFVGGLLAVLFNASFAPWRLLGMSYLLVTPYLLLAVCMGYMAGEFWILGEPKVLGDPSRIKDIGYFAASALALLLPVLVLIGGGFNWRVVDGREGGVVQDAALEILDRLEGRDILFTTGAMDQSIRYAVWEKRRPVCVISAPRTASPVYLHQLALRFREKPLRDALWNDDFSTFVETLLQTDEGVARVGIVDMPDLFRDFGYLIPDGLLYRLEPDADQVDVPALIELQQPYWDRMERMASHLAPKSNRIRPYQDLLLLLTSKVANNLGVMQAELGDDESALKIFRTARRLYPDNLCVLMNLLELGRTRTLPEAEALEKEWEELQDHLGGERWALMIRYGYLWHVREWVRRGKVWAFSGVPQSEEFTRGVSGDSSKVDSSLAQLLDQAYQVWGVPSRGENYYRSLLIRDPQNTDALMTLSRLALRKGDLEAAEAYMREALFMGLPEEALLFDRAMMHVVRGEIPRAVEQLRQLAQQTPGDVRVFLALVLLTDESDPVNQMARKIVKTHRRLNASGRLALARVFLAGQHWTQARSELEQVLQEDSQNILAWELMVSLAREIGNPALEESSLRALLKRKPDHYLFYQDQGVRAYTQGDLEKAEEYFRKGIEKKRDAMLLNNLAHVILERGGDAEEALALVNEALEKKPDVPGFLNTRGAIYLRLGRYEEARIDLQQSLKQYGMKKNLLLMLAESYEKLGDRKRALTVAKALAKKPDELTSDEKRQVRELIKRVR